MFQDLKVLELASVLAGPSVGQFFAELGAEVIKIENLKTGGDVTRSWKGNGEKEGDRSAYFCSCNWGKKSVAVDLTTPKGIAIVQKLAAQSHLVIASYKPGDADKLGVSYEQLSAINPQLIYGQITGYGSENERVGYDAVIQAEAGFMDLNGEKNGEPVKMPVALIDILAGHQLKEGLLLALLKKEKNGTGSFVEVSLIQTAIASLANQATNWLVAKKLPTRQGSSHPNIAPYGDSFVTRDNKRILLAVGSNKQFQRLMKVLDHSSIATLSEYSTNEARVINRNSLNIILAAQIGKFESKELLADLHRSMIPAGQIQTMKELFEMPEANEMLIRNGELTGVRNFAANWMGDLKHSLLPPPGFGEHTEEVLRSIAF
ncbi:CaiB/BaiF CoA-transferase family protein [soil metagenome]